MPELKTTDVKQDVTALEKTALDTQVGVEQAVINTAEGSYATTHGGKYRDVTPRAMIVAGITGAATITLTSYEGPLGNGQTTEYRWTSNTGERWIRTKNIGPETWRETQWTRQPWLE